MATDRFHITVALLQRDGRDLSRHLPFVAFRSSQIGYGVLGLVLQAENLTWMGRESETAGYSAENSISIRGVHSRA